MQSNTRALQQITHPCMHHKLQFKRFIVETPTVSTQIKHYKVNKYYLLQGSCTVYCIALCGTGVHVTHKSKRRMEWEEEGEAEDSKKKLKIKDGDNILIIFIQCNGYLLSGYAISQLLLAGISCVYMCVFVTTTMSMQLTWSKRCQHCILCHGFSFSITPLSSPLSESLLERSCRILLVVLSSKKWNGKPLILPFLPIFTHFHLFLFSMIHNHHL